MNVIVKNEGKYAKGTILELSVIETLTILTALRTLHNDGGRNELDRTAAKSMRKQIISALEQASEESKNDEGTGSKSTNDTSSL